MDKDQLKIAEDAFIKIQCLFPDLEMKIIFDDKFVDLSMDIPRQNGLDFDVNVNLQNEDELQISTSFICCNFFSIDNPDTVDDFVKAVQGLIMGEYRVLQFVRHGKVFKSLLQRPNESKWVTIYKHLLTFRLPWMRLEENSIQNLRNSKIIAL